MLNYEYRFVSPYCYYVIYYRVECQRCWYHAKFVSCLLSAEFNFWYFWPLSCTINRVPIIGSLGHSRIVEYFSLFFHSEFDSIKLSMSRWLITAISIALLFTFRSYVSSYRRNMTHLMLCDLMLCDRSWEFCGSKNLIVVRGTCCTKFYC